MDSMSHMSRGRIVPLRAGPWMPARHRFMASVYLQMGCAVALSAGAALLAAFSPVVSEALFTAEGLTGTGWLVALSPLVLVIAIGAGVERFSTVAARLVFVAYATLIGLSLGSIFRVYAGEPIGLSFAAAAAGFVCLAALGGATERDLGPLGSFGTVALFGLVAAMLINLFVRSQGFDLVLAAVTVVLFAGLTASDVQRLRQLHEERPQAAVVGALMLYLDVLNIALSLLRLTGRGRR